MNSESEQRRAPESPHEDIRQRLSMEQEDKLDGLQAKHDEVIDRLRGLGNQLDTIGAAKDDMRMEMEQLDDLQRRDPEAAARSRELLADEIRNDDIGGDIGRRRGVSCLEQLQRILLASGRIAG